MSKLITNQWMASVQLTATAAKAEDESREESRQALRVETKARSSLCNKQSNVSMGTQGETQTDDESHEDSSPTRLGNGNSTTTTRLGNGNATTSSSVQQNQKVSSSNMTSNN